MLETQHKARGELEGNPAISVSFCSFISKGNLCWLNLSRNQAAKKSGDVNDRTQSLGERKSQRADFG